MSLSLMAVQIGAVGIGIDGAGGSSFIAYIAIVAAKS